MKVETLTSPVAFEELVEMADAIKIAPKCLLRDQRGILLAANSTPV